MRARAGTLCPDDAHQLLDQLLHQATPVPEHEHPLNDFLAALAGAPPSDACGDGLALAIALFNRVCREAPQAAPFTDHTYFALVECCYRARRPNLALSFLGRFLKTGFNSDGLAANALIGRCRCRAMSCSSSSSPTLHLWSPIAAFSAATASVHKGTLSPEDAHHMFDKLLRQATPVPGRFLNAFLAALARAPSSDACRDGPALALALFNRVCREEEEGLQVAPLSGHTYNILMDFCCRARRPDLGLAIFGLFLMTGIKTNPIIVSTFLKCLCYAKRTDEAVDVLLRRMPDLPCAPNTFSCAIVAKGLCDDGRSQQALDLLQMVAKQGGTCSLGVVSYTTVIDGFLKEGQVSKACNLFHGMKQQRVMPNVVTYTSIIAALFKARAVDKAELFLRQMLHDGVQPGKLTYNIMIHGYSSLGQWKEASKMLKEMKSQGLTLNIATWNSLITSLHKHGRSHEAAGFFDSITAKCQEPQN
jgi:pentatricopeptide repeat protein